MRAFVEKRCATNIDDHCVVIDHPVLLIRVRSELNEKITTISFQKRPSCLGLDVPNLNALDHPPRPEVSVVAYPRIASTHIVRITNVPLRVATVYFQ